MQQTIPFGDWLRRTRGILPQQPFAAQLGIDTATVSRLERGENHVSVRMAVQICLGLDVPLAHFFAECVGSALGGAVLSTEACADALTLSDVRAWMMQIMAGDQRTRELLVSAVHLIVERGGEADQLRFVLTDIEKMLQPLPRLQMSISPPLRQEALIARIAEISRQGGLILPAEIGAYLRVVRERFPLTLSQLSRRCPFSASALTTIESSSFGVRLLLEDLWQLDHALQQDGALLSLVWEEIRRRKLLEQGWVDDGYTQEGKRALVDLLISVGRWLQVLYPNDRTWLAMLRHEIGNGVATAMSRS
ncbi:hypothetical protein KSF_107150 [Reticulibacter mediterranei]|uniref:HTH cro/C1-type domain-containing protein n=1 Tax=Reticulibacter mediterranei TaxID=2778369 RepID=A0A8J3NAR4_9CHLR|nr:helix-turn-helix transcriptional regulator [Reticulibacter mediterranei]GHP00668.1 hypothetical protein KSF_107150 [Reticulibacter mediterranei]